jgi:Response regulators consisting of a CheY-like receiver domain and a winged-helix DNA-binding domain
LQVNMARLRKKISEIGLENSIETVRGTGYQWREIKNHE